MPAGNAVTHNGRGSKFGGGYLISLGIEGTAYKLGVGIVTDKGEILANVSRVFSPKEGGLKPREAAQYYAENISSLIRESLEKANLSARDIDIVSFSQGPGMGPCLRVVATAARSLSLGLGIPIVGVNHGVAHIEIGRLITKLEDPLVLFVSGGNTQVITFQDRRYRVIGETMDMALGNCIDRLGRELGLEFPWALSVQELAKRGEKFIELPYIVKGMELSFSGLLTSALEKIGKVRPEDLCYSFLETSFAMLTEVAERGLTLTGKEELLLCGGVGALDRLKEMLKEMVSEHGAKLGVTPPEYSVDNGAMIAWTGILYYKSGTKHKIEETAVKQRFRIEEVEVNWR